MSGLVISNATIRRGKRDVIDQVSLNVAPGELVGLIGPNGAGKTTLMRAALGLLPMISGTSNIADMPAKQRAFAAAWLPQDRQIAWPVSVENVIALGRIPHLARTQKLGDADQAIIDDAITRMDLEALRHRTATHLSGGEQARVLIARTLAQRAPLLLADEPTAGLDPAAQISTMEVFASHAGEGAAVMVSLHDLGLAARHCTRLVMLHDGKIAADGPPDQVLSPENLQQVFGVTGYFANTETGPVFQPLEVVT